MKARTQHAAEARSSTNIVPQRKPWALALATGLGVFSISLLSACSGEPENGQGMGGDMPPAMVTVSSVTLTDADYNATYPARIRGAREVSVRAQVSGILQQRHYAEGEYIEQAQTLFQIDPELYELALNTAQANLATANANQAQAQREWDRVSDLYENNAASAREFDTARAAIDSANAMLLQAEAAVKDAQRNLRYTRVEAPISGITSMEVVSEGNLISAGAELTHITQIDTVHAHFAVPEHEAELLRNYMRSSNNGGQAALTLSDGNSYSEVGQINFVHTSVNASTARVELRAVFNNPEQQLRPGQFVRVTIGLQQYTDVALINPTAVSQGNEGAQVFVVVDDNTAAARPVTLGPVIDGKQVIIAGLEDGDELVVNGHVALADGAPVSITNGN